MGNWIDCRYCIYGDNRLIDIPPEIGQLGELQVLDMFDNDLTSLPAELGQLTGLRFLDVSSNPLDGALPAYFPDMTHLNFIFEDTQLCIPDEEVFWDWIENNLPTVYVQVPGSGPATVAPGSTPDSGGDTGIVVEAPGGDLQPQDGNAMLDWLHDNRVCTQQ